MQNSFEQRRELVLVAHSSWRNPRFQRCLQYLQPDNTKEA